MIKNILTIAVVSSFLLTSCGKETTDEKVVEDNVEVTSTENMETAEDSNNNMVTTKTMDKDGNELEVVFNQNDGTATIVRDGETIVLQEEKTASGYAYKNDQYELMGKGNDMQLMKDGKVIFEHEDEIINTTYKNDKGETLDLSVNATTNDAKAYLNGGEQIDLKGENAASGFWFKNDQYELSGKGNNVELKKDGEIVFKN